MVWLWTVPAFAHEAGIGRAVVTFPSDDEYVVDLTVDAGSLLSRLEVLAGRPRSETLTAPEYAARIATLQQELMKHVRVRFDGLDVGVALESVRAVDDSGSSAATLFLPQVRLRMNGRIPRGTKSMTWRYDLTYASYALSVTATGRAEESAEWLEGGQESRALVVNPVSRGLPRILSKTFDYLPFALMILAAIFPFTRRSASASI
jgi:hypothetical protein